MENQPTRPPRDPRKIAQALAGTNPLAAKRFLEKQALRAHIEAVAAESPQGTPPENEG